MGRHPLAPVISPKKTIEGLAGGLSSPAHGLHGSWLVSPEFSGLDCLVLGILLTITGLLGRSDRIGHQAKRRHQRFRRAILPGHGGMLDRLDSLLFTAPAFYYYVTMTNRLTSHRVRKL